MSEMFLKQLLKGLREKISILIFGFGFLLIIAIAFDLVLTKEFGKGNVGKITLEAASTQVGFDSWEKDSNNITTSVKEFEIYRTYVVLPGDSLWTIAHKNYSDPLVWSMIYELNKDLIGENPDLIFPLTQLKLPNIQ